MAYKMQSLPATHSEMTDLHLEKKFKLGIYSFIFSIYSINEVIKKTFIFSFPNNHPTILQINLCPSRGP